VALLKDSSLVSAIGVAELTKLGQIEGARTFDYIRTFSAVAVLYLILTLLLSLGVQALEHVSRRSAR
jgi:polar amino acid transport system permease protein